MQIGKKTGSDNRQAKQYHGSRSNYDTIRRQIRESNPHYFWKGLKYMDTVFLSRLPCLVAGVQNMGSCHKSLIKRLRIKTRYRIVDHGEVYKNSILDSLLSLRCGRVGLATSK